MAIKFDKINDGEYALDVRGYSCPHPQMYTKKALDKLTVGDVLKLIFDNPSSGESINSMLESAGHDLFNRDEEGGTFSWQIRKG